MAVTSEKKRMQSVDIPRLNLPMRIRAENRPMRTENLPMRTKRMSNVLNFSTIMSESSIGLKAARENMPDFDYEK